LVVNVDRESIQFPDRVDVLGAHIVIRCEVVDVVCRSANRRHRRDETGKCTLDLADGSGTVEDGGRPVVEVGIEFVDTDVNVLGSLPDWDLIKQYYETKYGLRTDKEETFLKIQKSIKRFKSAIENTFLTFKNEKSRLLFDALIRNEGLSKDFLYFLFWNTSVNNALFHAINTNVYFVAFYSGRIALKNDDVLSYLKELKLAEPQIQKWSLSTLNITASKYLTLLKKFGLLEGKQRKSILHPFLSDKMFIIFIYWISAISERSNLLNSEWLKYGFMETELLLQRLMKNKFSDYFYVYYTGDNLRIETKVEYGDLYEAIIRN
jgi:hypothetical protein